MSNTVAGLIGLGMMALLAVALFVLCRASESGHGSRFRDLDEALERLKKAETLTAKLFVFFYFGRSLVRTGNWGYCAAAITAFGIALAGLFGGGWEIGRQMLCDVLRFLENMIKGKAMSCSPPPPGSP